MKKECICKYCKSINFIDILKFKINNATCWYCGRKELIKRMKTDKQLLKIFDDKEKSPKDFWVYERLTHEEKIKIFDLILKREMEGGKI